MVDKQMQKMLLQRVAAEVTAEQRDLAAQAAVEVKRARTKLEGLQGTLSWPQERQKISGVSREPARTQQQQLVVAGLRAATESS